MYDVCVWGQKTPPVDGKSDELSVISGMRLATPWIAYLCYLVNNV